MALRAVGPRKRGSSTNRTSSSYVQRVTLTPVKSFRNVLLLAAVTSCGSGRPPEDVGRSALRTPIAGAADPTLHPARLVPVRPGDDDKTFGSEAGGGKRMLVSGVRVIRLAGGGIAAVCVVAVPLLWRAGERRSLHRSGE